MAASSIDDSKASQEKSIVDEASKNTVSKKNLINNKKLPLLQKETKIVSGSNLYPKDYPDLFKDYDKNSKSVWSSFTPNILPKEQLIFDVKYFGITCGKITLSTLEETKIGDKDAYHFFARIKSAPFYKYIYTLDDYVESYIDKETFLPIKYSLVQRESAQKVDDLQLFDHRNFKTHYWYKREKKDRDKEENKITFVPKYFQDSFSILFFIRGLPLKIGDTYSIPVITRSESWLLIAYVREKEILKLPFGEVEALKLETHTHYPGVLKKRGEIYFWFSSDETHRPLQFEAKVKIGKVEGQLVEYK